MALLKFKQGLAENLPVYSTDTVGTVYITSDSQEMKVDLPTGRVKVSDFISVTAAELETVTVHENLFYYITDTKTIVKYVGEDEQGKRIWEGINNTDQITGINTRLITAESEIDALQTADSTLNRKIDELNASDIETTDEIVVTTAVGNYSVGQSILANTSVQDLLLSMLCADSAPTITQPSLTISGDAVYIEVGSSKDVTVSATYSDGNYQYGYALLEDGSIDTDKQATDSKEKAPNTHNDGTTGADLTYLDLQYGSGTVLTSTTTSNSVSYTVNSGIKTSKTSSKVYSKASHNAGYIPVSILKNKYDSKAIAANSNKTTDKTVFYWYIPMFHGFKYGTDLIVDPANITASEIKGLNAITGSTAYNQTQTTSETATSSWRQYFIAVPASYGWELKEIIDSNNLPLTIGKTTNNVTLTFGSGEGTTASIAYEVFYVNLDADYDTTKITLKW